MDESQIAAVGIKPGLLVLHGNRLELLRDAVFEWLARRPLAPLEEEVFLVQSNGTAEWLKMALAHASGICACTRVELPGRFLWRTYRQVLGRASVPTRSALDKDAMTWRLMRLLPQRMQQPGFEPVAGFLRGGDLDRRLQLAQQLADLYDQYQVYRADWLAAWGTGRDLLLTPIGATVPLPDDQRWQAALWRDLLSELNATEQRASRPQVHRDFLAAIAAGAAPAEPLPRRVTLFGASHVPGQTLEALASLARHTQVLLAIPNPCRFHWADIIEGRELLRPPRQRHPLRGQRSLATVPLEAMHAHAHPLLAAWGRQGRDFMRQLDAFDDAERARQRFDVPRVDLFDDGIGATMLEQVQASIRDLLPLAEHPPRVSDAADRSIVFHIAHSAQREVEILHDQLLGLLASPSVGPPLRPRDIVVMVPDIDTFAPAIRAVFAAYPRDDARFIPFEIADLKHRGSNALMVAVEWLLRLPNQRFGLAEIRDLLDVPAIARRFGLHAEDLPRLSAWMAGAGIRWGLHAEQRAQLGLAACGEQNSLLFGLRRMLLGYASGAAAPFDDIAPYDEVGGLEASLVGVLADVIDRLAAWWSVAGTEATPRDWAVRGRALLEALVEPTDERERLTVAALQGALSAWLETCEAAGFEQGVPLSVLREAWLAAIDSPGVGGRFLAGGVTFCTLMPLRAVPFEVVCLLGLNDGDYPRQSRRSDLDLMALPGQQRPGDRSRRDDDRYLMLDALLSARRVLYISWSGRSARDNTEQPPSVLVSQLRDYLAAAWNSEPQSCVLGVRTTEHPLQPFSRRYFEGRELFTYAREWRAAHRIKGEAQDTPAIPPFEATGVALTVDELARFLKNPVKEYFKRRLAVVFHDDEAIDDDEPFALDGLTQYALLSELLADPDALAEQSAQQAISKRLIGIKMAGRLPIGHVGACVADEIGQTALQMLSRWRQVYGQYPQEAPKQPLRFEHEGLVVDDWLDGLRFDGTARAWIELSASRLADSKAQAVRADKLITAWVRMLVANVNGECTGGVMVGRDVTLNLSPPDAAVAGDALRDLVAAWREGMQAPLPLAAQTALAWVAKEKTAEPVYEGGYHGSTGEGQEPCLSRLFPDFSALTADGRFEDYAARLFGPLLQWVESSVHIVQDGEPASAADE